MKLQPPQVTQRPMTPAVKGGSQKSAYCMNLFLQQPKQVEEITVLEVRTGFTLGDVGSE